MGWENSNRREHLPADWQKRRARVLHVASHRCQVVSATGERCTAPANEVDHIIAGDDHAYTNLQAICRDHHRAKTAAEAHAARNLRRRQPESHPGDKR